MNETLKPWEQGAIYDLRRALKRWPDTLSITLTAARVVISKDGVEVESFPLKQPPTEPSPVKRTAPQPSVWTWEAVPGEDERAWRGSTPGEGYVCPRVAWEGWRWKAYVLTWEDGQWLVHPAGSWNDLIGAQAAASREAWEMIQVRRLMEDAAPLSEHIWDCDLPGASGC